MPRKWSFATHDEAVIRRISGSVNVSPLVAQVLASRGMEDKEQIESFLRPKLSNLHPPEALPGMEEAADRVVSALKNKRRITIYGDYDVDGVTSTSLLWHCLQLSGGNVDYYIPSRLEEGYGINCDALRTLHEEDPDRLVVSVDCGITSVTEAALAKELGLELIITDHHNLADELPDACLVHPRLPGSDYPFHDLCGAGVAFKLAWAICKKLGDGKKATPRMREFLIGAVGLAAIGTVADLVPLYDENRVIVRFGMYSLREKASQGMKLLMEVSGLDEKPELFADDVAFALGPRINAAGRLGQARLAVELLTTSDTDRAKQLADYLNQLNKNRQKVERKIFKQAKEQVEENNWGDDAALVLSHDDWHPGVIGIVASRVVEKFNRPVIMVSFANDSAVGVASGRSFAGFDLHSGLKACREHLQRFGGHKAAAGMKIDRPKLDDFRAAFVQHVKDNHVVTESDLELRLDAEVSLQDCNLHSVKELDRLGPFGQKNPKPRFAASHVEVVGEPRTMGEGGRHLTLQLRQFRKTMRAVAFGQGEWAEPLMNTKGPISIAFAPTINSFRGFQKVEIQLFDWKPAHEPHISVTEKPTTHTHQNIPESETPF